MIVQVWLGAFCQSLLKETYTGSFLVQGRSMQISSFWIEAA